MNNTQDVKHIALQRALVLLNGIGAQYKVIHEGMEYGELIAVVKPTKTRAKVNSFAPLYRHLLDDMKVGDVLTWEHENAEGLRSAITANAHRIWGTGSTVSTVTGNKVELLRVS